MALRLSLSLIIKSKFLVLQSNPVNRQKVCNSVLLNKRWIPVTKNQNFSTMPSAHASETTVKGFQRLPSHVVPKNYHITLQPNLKTFVFEGEETVTVDVNQSTSIIVLNAKELEIASATFKTSKGDNLKASEIKLDEENEIATISFPCPIETGEGDLHLVFTGTLNDKMKGLYRSKYSPVEGQPDRYSAVTQFESTDARRAFPCWDEPALKATFEMTLVVQEKLVALSNMPVVSTTPRGDTLKVVKFAPSPIMSTYLVAVVVGEYDYVETKDANGVDIRVYTPVGKKEQGQFALDVAAEALPYYKDYFNIAYPLPKMDLIAISDFASGAMENWGLVTYRETCLLVDPQNTSADKKQWIALVVGHELAHQWFGNLVTMEWWTHLWLNEGFASFVEFLCVDKLFPSYQIWMQFVTSVYMRALELDGLHNSHAIEVPVGHPSEIDEIFDDISYSKGASVIRMLHRYLGDENFRKGMELYLKRHKYRNTQTEDLWDALEETSNKPVRNVMSTWTKQKGFPVISVSQVKDGNNRVLTLKQEKFCSDGKLPDAEKSTIWMAPITFITASSPTKPVHETLLSTAQSSVTIAGVPDGDWIKLNQDTVGVYRVQYSPDMLQELLPAIQSKTLPPLDRLGLQNDLFAMVQAGRSKTVDVLKLMSAFKHEDDYAVWSSINSCLGRLNVLLSHTDYQESLHIFGRQLMSEIYNKLGWEAKTGESHMDTLLRSLVIGRLASFQDPGVLERAKKLFESHSAGTGMIPADIRSAVYVAVAQSADEKSFNALFKV